MLTMKAFFYILVSLYARLSSVSRLNQDQPVAEVRVSRLQKLL